MSSVSKALREEIKHSFYPFIKERGFIKQKSVSPYFAKFSRQRNGRTETFDLQWDKYWRPYFVLNFGSREQGEQPGRLQRSRGGDQWHWFSLRRPWLKKLTSGKWNYTPAQVSQELIAAFGELETWWETGVAGPHIYIYELHA